MEDADVLFTKELMLAYMAVCVLEESVELAGWLAVYLTKSPRVNGQSQASMSEAAEATAYLIWLDGWPGGASPKASFF